MSCEDGVLVGYTVTAKILKLTIKTYRATSARTCFTYISLQNARNVHYSHEKLEVVLASRVTHLAGSPFFEGRMIRLILAGHLFLI